MSRKKKEIIAMLLAGGKGTRLGVMTRDLAKPSVPFGGEYHLIDFPLSNCSNSGIDTVGVLTQYEPLTLHSTLGGGSSWDLDRRNGGLTVLPPYIKGKKGASGQWYQGTADAVYRNMEFIDLYDPVHVLILSGDHVYKMDYRKMLTYHREKGAQATVGVISVPREMTSQFGIMDTDQEDGIVEFEEKPKFAQSTLASMGIYIFNWKTLRKQLMEDSGDPDSEHDFGKNIIPGMLDEGYALYAYRHRGYWMDVGTIKSYWEAHMDLLNPGPGLDLHNRDWIIYSKNPHLPPLYISPEGEVDNAMVNKGARISGRVYHSVVFYGVRVEPGAVIRDSVIMPNVTIRRGARVERSIICQDTELGAGSRIGIPPEGDPDISGEDEITVIGSGRKIADNTTIHRGEVRG